MVLKKLKPNQRATSWRLLSWYQDFFREIQLLTWAIHAQTPMLSNILRRPNRDGYCRQEAYARIPQTSMNLFGPIELWHAWAEIFALKEPSTCNWPRRKTFYKNSSHKSAIGYWRWLLNKQNEVCYLCSSCWRCSCVCPRSTKGILHCFEHGVWEWAWCTASSWILCKLKFLAWITCLSPNTVTI